jgi:hypothetical protein
MIEEKTVSFDEIFARWLASSLAATYDNVAEIGHLQMACAGRGLSAEETDTFEELKSMLLSNDFIIYYKNVEQTIASKSPSVSLRERIKRTFDCGLTPDASISDIVLNRKYVDPVLLRIGELQWVVFLFDPESDATEIMPWDRTELTARYINMRHKCQSGDVPLPMRSTISSGGDRIPVPMKEMDIANRTIGRLAEIYEHVALRDGVGEDYALDTSFMAWASH